MALLYTFTITSPEAVYPEWPIEITQGWRENLATVTHRYNYLGASDISMPTDTTGNWLNTSAFIFKDEAEMSEFMAKVKLTDEQQAILDEWSAEYNISYIHNVYQLPDATFDNTKYWC
jgi:hypothetical protein